MLTPEDKKTVEMLRNDPNIEWKPGLTDEEILEQARFVETGEGMEVYNSLEEYREAQKRKKAAENIDVIDEV
jgi:hypothetical protein